MVQENPKIQGLSIVLIGDFNPKIFQPAWFGMEGLIARKDVEDAEIQIVHPDIVKFNLKWLFFNVTRERIRQIEAKVLQKLKEHPTSVKIRPN